MSRSRLLWTLAIGVAGIVALAAIFTRGTAESPAAVPLPATVREVMATSIDPAADALWESVGTTVTSDGVEERAPKSDDEWRELERQALRLGDGARALLAPALVRDAGPWRDFARALETASLVSLQAARARNRDAIFESGEGILKACDSCHEQYWAVADQEKALKNSPEEAP